MLNLSVVAGHTEGSFQVNEAGAGTCDIDIKVPTGTSGIEPHLSITYSSQSGDGMLGTGWTISGQPLSVISRSVKTIAQDGIVKGIDMSNNDVLALDGERIIAINDSIYGQEGTKYRTEQNAFYQIQSFGNVNGFPEKFKVWTHDGLVMEYGSTTDSRIEAQGSTKVLFWALNKVQDTKGNYYTISYEENNANGEYLPSLIEYTGNAAAGLSPYATVEFIYENRINSSNQFVSGALMKASKRLSKIIAKYGSTEFRTYNFTYQTGKDLFASLQECVGNDCFKPTILGWKEERSFNFGVQPTNILPPTDLVNANFVELTQGDWNGDGKQDFLRFNISTGSNKWFFNTGSFLFTQQVRNDVIAPSDLANGYFHSIDLNADGFDDFMWHNPANGATKWYLNQRNTNNLQFNRIDNLIPNIPANAILEMGDFNGDALPDIMVRTEAGFNKIFLNRFGRNQSLSFEGLPDNLIAAAAFTSNADVSIMVQDFNGDGLTDVFWYYKPNGGNRMFMNAGNNTFTAQYDVIAPALIANGSGISIGNFNADGLPDIFWYNPADGSSRFFYNKGANTFLQTTGNLPAYLVTGSGGTLAALDFNSDGLSDLMFYHPSSGTNRWFANNGNCDFTRPLNPFNATEVGFSNPITPSSILNAKAQFGNFAGNGVTDVMWYNQVDGTNRWFSNAMQVSSTLISMTDGQGAKTDIQYGVLTDNSLYIKENNDNFGTIDFQGHYPVVKSYSIDNGIGGTTQISYLYKGAKLNVQGRGFRGFSEITTTDGTTGNTEKKFFNRDYRHINSAIVRSELRLANGTLVSETNYLDTLILFYNTMPKVNFAYTTKTHSKAYELTGALYQTTRTRDLKDDYGNTILHVVDHGDGSKDSTVSVYNNPIFQNQWLLGRLQRVTVYRTVAGQTSAVRNATFEYNATTGLLIKETILPDSSVEKQIVKTYIHDVYGNIIESRETAHNGVSMEERVTRTTFDERGRFTRSVVNPIGHTERRTYNDALNVQTQLIDANGLVINYLYDSFGRLIRTEHPDGNWENIIYTLCTGGNCPNFAVYNVQKASSNHAPMTTYFDKLGREIRTTNIAMDGRVIYTDKVYNERGLLAQSSEPYFVGDSIKWTTMEYDLLGRDIKHIAPGNSVTQTAYNGFTTLLLNALNQRKTVTKNGLGHVIRVLDNDSNPIRYEYDAAGNQTAIVDVNGNAFRSTFDVLGRKIALNDPDLGETRYVYNQFHELLQETDAKGATTSFTYDVLNRPLQRTENEGITNWSYDTRTNGVGKIAAVFTDLGYRKDYGYDNLGRTFAVSETIGNQSYTTSYTYNLQGKIATITYPDGFRIKNIYNNYHYLIEVRNDSSNQLYWRLDSVNAKGQILKQTLGEQLTTRFAYDSNKDFLQSIVTQKANGNIQDLTFGFNDLGHLTQRKNRLRNLQEDFSYDPLNRLTQANLSNRSVLTMRYDKLGNIVFKSDVGTYTYNSPRPHAVTNIALVSDTICIPSQLVAIAYTSFDKVRTLKRQSDSLSITYNADYQRIIQKTYLEGSLKQTRIHVGDLYEKEITGSETKILHYIKVNGETIAVYTTQQNGQPYTRYWLKDHLGSLHIVADSVGTVIEELSYDAWGKRRNADWTANNQRMISPLFARGFTGHEHIDIFDLVNMNGRVYDPVLGRFLSPDPFIHDVTDSQNLNRYSYLENNPLSGTDPTGYKKKRGWFRRLLGKAIRVVAAVVIGIATAGVATMIGAATLGAAILSGAAVGFGSSVSASVLAGQSAKATLKAAFRGAVIGSLTAGIGWAGHSPAWSTGLKKVILEGAKGGVESLGNGGKFSHGFLTGSLRAAKEGTSWWAQTIVSAIEGGIKSKSNGGKFLNGAVTGAFATMFGHFKTYIEKIDEPGFRCSLVCKWGTVVGNSVYLLGKAYHDFEQAKSAGLKGYTQYIQNHPFASVVGGVFGGYKALQWYKDGANIERDIPISITIGSINYKQKVSLKWKGSLRNRTISFNAGL